MVLVGLLIALNAAFAGSEVALLSLNEGQIARLSHRSGAGRLVARLAADPNEYLATVQVGITLAGFLASATAALALADPVRESLEPALGAGARPVAVGLVTVALTFLTLVAGELTPKRLAMQWSEPWSLVAARPLAVLSFVARPATWLLGQTTNTLVRLAGGDPALRRSILSTEELAYLVGASAVTSAQRDILTGTLEAGERLLREVMVPRNEVLVLGSQVAAAEARRRLSQAGHHRAPVTDTDLDDATAIVQLLDLTEVEDGAPVGDYVRPALVFPETLPVLRALRRLQHERHKMALVADEHGGIAGIVTVEDLVEELVGEIFDESDRDVAVAQRNADGTIDVPGRYPVHDTVDLGIALPTDPGEYTTVAGFVMQSLGRLPRAGDVVSGPGWEVTVLETRRTRVTRVRLRAVDAAEDASLSN